MARYLGQAIVHALVAALVVEALIRVWRVEEPAWRQRLRLLVLAAALAAPPLFDLLAPVRREEWFEERWALLSGRHWAELTIHGVGVYWLFLAWLGGMGSALFLADLIPFLRHRLQRARTARLFDPALEDRVAALAAEHGLPPPSLVLLDTDAPVLLCRGVRRPELVLSRGALALLDPRELQAALAHELCHLRSRDPGWSWLLMAARALQAFNPVVQVVVRAVARDAERRADDAAGQTREQRLALASAIVRLYRVQAAPGGGRAWTRLLAQARSAAIEERCRRLIDGAAPAPAPSAPARFCAAGVSLAALLFFVV